MPKEVFMHVVHQMTTGTLGGLLHMSAIGQNLRRFLKSSHDMMVADVLLAGIMNRILSLIVLFLLKIQDTWSFCDD